MTALKKLLARKALNLADAVALLENREEWQNEVFSAAQAERKAQFGNRVYIRGLIEISCYCVNDCYYCGLRRSNPNAKRYRLSQEEILHQAALGNKLGIRTFVLQGGEDPYFTDDRLSELVKTLKALYPDTAITLSMGERSAASYKMLREAGADRYLLRHESADQGHYAQLHPEGMSAIYRQSCLRELKALGYQTGAGMMVGSPGQKIEHLAQDLLFLQDLQPEMVGIGPYIHAQDTPFAERSDGDVDLTLYILALVRLLLPIALIPATTALTTLDESARMRALITSANVLMPNLTPPNHRADYAIYADKKAVDLESVEGLADLKAQLSLHG
ncbi:MAG: [FeFe] hydrogenase H-cluster radical SAM maturase HydE, partial [Chloroflexi bacterium]|nr:[FeFe] hydrogenase H-cluster radical SAM maturase HydE [Chloroflexota bacterium]